MSLALHLVHWSSGWYVRVWVQSWSRIRWTVSWLSSIFDTARNWLDIVCIFQQNSNSKLEKPGCSRCCNPDHNSMDKPQYHFLLLWLRKPPCPAEFRSALQLQLEFTPMKWTLESILSLEFLWNGRRIYLVSMPLRVSCQKTAATELFWCCRYLSRHLKVLCCKT